MHDAHCYHLIRKVLVDELRTVPLADVYDDLPDSVFIGEIEIGCVVLPDLIAKAMEKRDADKL